MLTLIKITWPIIAVMAFNSIFLLAYNLVGMTFLAMAVQCALILAFSTKQEASLLSIFSIFSLLFFALIPWLHFSYGIVIWRTIALDEMTYVDTNLAIIFANFAVVISYSLVGKSGFAASVRPYHISRGNITRWALIAFSMLGFLGVLQLSNFNPQLLLFRGLVDQVRDVVFTSSSVSQIFSMVSRLAPAFVFYFAMAELKGSWFLKAALFVILILSVFPTGVARYMVAYVYIPVLMVLFPMARNGTFLSLTFLLSILLVFPFLDQFRYFSSFADLRFLPTASFFFAAHFDAYENFASAVEAGFITNGYQLVGAFFFFIPRTLWPDKPVGSGYEMANNLGYTFNNISMPFLGEGYVNFGFFGVIVFALFLGFVMARIDHTFTSLRQSGRQSSYQMSVYYFQFGALFFLLRGDLMSSFAYLSAGFAVAWFIGKTMRLLNSRVNI